MTWTDRASVALLLFIVVANVGDCAASALASSASIDARHIAAAIDRNTKAIKDQTRKCR